MMTMMVVSMVEAFRKPRRCFSPILSNANGRKWPNWPSGGAFLLVDFGFFNDGRFWLFRFRKSIWCRCDKSSFEIFGELILRVSLWKSRFREKWLVLRCLYNIQKTVSRFDCTLKKCTQRKTSRKNMWASFENLMNKQFFYNGIFRVFFMTFQYGKAPLTNNTLQKYYR